MQMVLAVPEGGNWKNIPDSIPSQRLEQIRESYARGEGSRSTYYGRLHRDRPSYTINTYFNRPGNGCHIHYEQDRVLSYREAARLQSFPDCFEFIGNQGSILKQIGNAVPPLLAYQIAKSLGAPGCFVDLFAGAGGMGFGFKMAGWTPIVANDIEASFLNTYRKNVHNNAIVGSITDPSIFQELIHTANSKRRADKPLWVLGGPPCQGFSTAGNRRTMEDPRNQLAWNYVEFLEKLHPDGFVFENVTGLLNMHEGKVFSAVKEAFSTVVSRIDGTVFSAEEHAVPQRRKRVILVGQKRSTALPWAPPPQITSMVPGSGILQKHERAISVEEAISDLPQLAVNEDGRGKPYRHDPISAYQAVMRGEISFDKYIEAITCGKRSWPI